jgi:hypothetical protein
MRKASLCLLAALPLMAAEQFAWVKHEGGRIELQERGKTVLVYNHGPQLKEGAPEDRRRCCYIYPLLTPGGVSMLDDFPKDHYHHRGLFWGWPVVETPSGKFDNWMMKGIHDREDGRLQAKSSGKAATLEVWNGWYTDQTKVMNERVLLTVKPAQGATRELEVKLTLEAVGGPVTLRGSQEKGKSYGGFSARFAERAGTVIRTEAGTLAKDEDLVGHAWAELEAAYGGKKAALRITPDEKDAGTPYQWCLRGYGFVGASVPGRSETVDGLTLQPGKPRTFTFRVQVRDVP